MSEATAAHTMAIDLLCRAEEAARVAADAHAGELSRIADAKAALAAIDVKILATAHDDAKAIGALAADRTGVSVSLEILERVRLPRAEEALAEAQRAHAAAAKEARRAQLAVLTEEVEAGQTKFRALLDEAFASLRSWGAELRQSANAAVPLEKEFGEQAGRLWTRALWTPADPTDTYGFIGEVARLYRAVLEGEQMARNEESLRRAQAQARP